MKLTYYGHSCFSVDINGVHILFDPFISGNPLAKHINLDEIKADYILLSHGHADHVFDCEAIAIRTGALVVCSYEIHEWLNSKGVTNTHPMNTGGRKQFDAFSVKCTVAQHSSGLHDGTYGGNPMGFILQAGDASFYYSGDTALTTDMQLITHWAQLNFAVMPIGDNFTMGVEDAILAAKMCGAKKVLGVHYDTFGFIVIDHDTAVKAFAEAGLELVLMQIGETREL